MSQGHVETVRTIYERWSRGDFRPPNELPELFDPLVLFVLGPGFPEPGPYLGLEQFTAYTRGFLEPWERISIAAEEIRPAGDSVVVSALQSGVGIESGAPTEFRYTQVWTFRGSKVTRLEAFRDHAEALAAVDLAD